MRWVGLVGVLVAISVAKVAVNAGTGGSEGGSGKKHYSESAVLKEIEKGNYVPYLEMGAKAANEKLPMTVDDETTLDSITAGPGLVMNYSYTKFKIAKEDVSATEMAAFRPKLIEMYKTEESLKHFRDGNVEMRYHYHDKNHELIASVVISPKDF